ncbi:MAG: glycosyltransferase family 2 protein [Hyphomicrobiales bacterium]|nr:glycosyltransferase family 2 protein [Hyphomicrobiales bacterium]
MQLFLSVFNYKSKETPSGISSVVMNTRPRGLMRFKIIRRIRRSFSKKWLRLKTYLVARPNAQTAFPEFFVARSKEEQAKLLLSLCKEAQTFSLESKFAASSAETMSVRIGVVLYNNSDGEVARLLRSIKFSELQPGVKISVALLNNGDPRSAPECNLSINFRQSTKNLGFGSAHNILMREAFDTGCDVYIGVNPDGFFEQEAIAAMLHLHTQKGQRALIEAVQFPEEHPKVYHPQTLETNWISGACFLYPKNIWSELGGYDENFFVYCEDVDLSWRARVLGIPTLTCPEALFYHDIIDRSYDPARNRHLFIAGRYLAYKWRSENFRLLAESSLQKLGVSKQSMPKLGPDSVRMAQNLEPVASFAERFHFAETRW